MSRGSHRRVLIAYTGGTIGMRESRRGWRPEAGFLQEQMATHPTFSSAGMPEYEIIEFSPLLDSANMAPENWVHIAEAVADRYEEFDGFVVLHGTDTMAYTASALAFILEDLGKPVIVTGSQIPLSDPRSDALDNLVHSLLLAADFDLPEVALYFHSRLYRGCRVSKVNCSGFDAFESPNLPPLAEVGIDIDIDWSLVRRPGIGSALTVQTRLDPSVGVLWLFPGITGAIVRNFLQPPLRGVVLQAYGVGNGPVANEGFLGALTDARDRDVVIVDCSQCLYGGVVIDEYATGQGMARAGAVSGYDMTPEAALTKLAYLFGQGRSPAEVRDLMGRSLRGELTLPQIPPAAEPLTVEES